MIQRHDEWIVGEGVIGRDYLIHTLEPRFIAEIFDEPPLDKFEFSLSNGQTLANFVWSDDPPTSKELIRLLARADEALADYDLQLKADLNKRDEDEYDEDD